MKDKVAKLIGELQIAEDRKKHFLGRVDQEGVTETLLNDLFVENHGLIESKMKEAGLFEGEEYEAARKKMIDDVEAAKVEFEKGIEEVDREVDDIEEQVSKDVSKAQAEEIKGKIE